jgi:hypothetical protein
MTVTISAAFRLEGSQDLAKMRAQPTEHFLDHMVRADPKNAISNLSRQMPITQVPCKTGQLAGISMSDFHELLMGGLDLKPPSIFELQPISISHCGRLRKIKQDIVTLIRGQKKTPTVTRIKVESERAGRPL